MINENDQGGGAAPTEGGMHPASRGPLLTDGASVISAADDFGHVIHRAPLAVLRPRSEADVVSAVRQARERGVSLSIRGGGHSMFGQTQSQGGFVLDMSELGGAQIAAPDRIRVGAGATWGEVLDTAMAGGRTIPALPDSLLLTVGGMLSVGGMTRSSHRYGFQVDGVIDLDIVTGEGEVVTCSMSHERELFEMTLAGLGQCGVLTRATISMIEAKQRARTYRLVYRDLDAFLRDQARLVVEEAVDAMIGLAVPGPDGEWMFLEEISWYYDPPEEPRCAAVLAGLSHERGMEQSEDRSYIECMRAPDAQMAQMKAAGLWGIPHPWLDLFVPGSASAGYFKDVLASVRPADVAPGFLILGAVNARRAARPLVRLPDEDIVFIMDICRFVPEDPALVAGAIAQNRRLFEAGRALGGTLYPVGAVPMSRDDWRAQFGPSWPRLEAAKRRFDPQNVLSPGLGIFADNTSQRS